MKLGMRSTFTLFTILVLAACSRGKQTQVIVPEANQTSSVTSSGFACNAVLSKTVVSAGETVTLQVTASGGTAPYSIPNYSTGFASSTTLYGAFNNSGSTDLVVTRAVSVLDAAGRSSVCGFTVTVLSPTAGASNLSCSIDYSPTSVKPASNVTFTLSASGGTGSYSFGAFSPRTGVSLGTTIVSSNQVSVTTQYPDSGTYEAYMTVTSNGRSATCSKSVLVSNPIVSLYAEPSSTSDLASPIRVRAMFSGFQTGLTPIFSYTTSEPGIQITKSIDETSADVKVVDGNTHDFVLTATATLNGITATNTIQLKFTPALNCSVSVGSNPAVGSPVRFTVTASTGEALLMTDFYGADSILGTGLNYVDAKFLIPGQRLVQVRARSLTRTAVCNAGALISQIVAVNAALNRCDVNTSPSTSVVGAPVLVTAVLPPNVGVGPFKIDLSSDGSYQTITAASGLSQTIKFQNPGSWRLDMKVTDLFSGAQVTCSGYHVATLVAGLEARVFPVPNGYGALTDSFDGQVSNQKFVAYNVDVPDRDWSYGFPGVVGYKEWFAVSFRGRLNITTAGLYRFKLRSDDGVLLYIDGNLVVSDNNVHAPRNSFGSVTLNAGMHDIKLLYFQGPRVLISCQLSWQPPYQSYYSVVPTQVLSQPLNPLP